MRIPFQSLLPVDAAQRRLLAWAILLAALLGLAAIWAWTPLGAPFDLQTLGPWLTQFRDEPWGPLVVLALFIIGGLLVLPVTLMVLVTVMVYGPILGFAYAMAGSTVSGILSFAIGRRLGHRQIERLAGSRIHDLSRRIGRHGVKTLTILRIVPVAHFTVVSLAAGTSHVRLVPFVVGTVLGMVPGMLVLIVLLDRLVAAARQPDSGQIALAMAAGGVVIALLLGLRWWIRTRRPARRAG